MAERIFTSKDKDNKDIELVLRKPSQLVLNKADLARRVEFSRALTAGVCLAAQVDRLLKERGIWGETEEAHSKCLREKIIALENSLEGVADKDVGARICLEIKEARATLYEHNSLYLSATENTCESMATTAMHKVICAECVYKKDGGAKVFKDAEDFSNRLDETIAMDAFREVIISSLEDATGRSLPTDLESEYKENKWMKENAGEKVQTDVNDTTEVAEVKKPKKK